MAAPLDVTIQGMALDTFGLTANQTIAGLGLNTFGFLWPCDGIWQPSDSPIMTTWVSCDSAATVEVCND